MAKDKGILWKGLPYWVVQRSFIEKEDFELVRITVGKEEEKTKIRVRK